jgi:putative DNA methylase
MTTIKPITHSVQALPHTPVYRMHRYFARRPYNLIHALIEHYSRPGDVILDPFCGGGTTVIEGLRLCRKVIGIDLNPMAVFITRCEAMNIDLSALEVTLKIVFEATQFINELYSTTCPHCSAKTFVDWTMWSVVYLCPRCRTSVVAAEAEKLRPGEYRCPTCQQPFLVSHLPRAKDHMIKQQVNCTICGYRGEKGITGADVKLFEEIERDFETIIEREALWYPLDEMPTNYELRKPHNLICQRFCDFFTKRNLLALAYLLKAISGIEDAQMRYFMHHVFTSVVTWVNRMIVEPHHGWPLHAYWLADTYFEMNVWNLLQRRGQWALRGKRYSSQEIGDYYREAQSAVDILEGNATCWLLAQSATQLPLPDRSVATIITDPPYGGNVMYSELSNFWAVWLKETLGLDGLIDNTEEAIKSEAQGKGDAEYEELVYSVLQECFRVLRDDGWLVMTFNSRESGVWFSLLRAAQRAGFQLPAGGIVYQTPIEDYTRTLYQRRDGAMLGDFILSLRKEKQASMQPTSSSLNVEETVLNVIRQRLEQGPATFSEVYQAVVPVLFNSHMLDTQVATVDIEQLLFDHFVWQEIPLDGKGLYKKPTIRKWMLRKTYEEQNA